LGLSTGGTIDLDAVVRAFAPSILVAATGVPGAITESAVRDMATSCGAPIVLPLSNPTSKCEATPSDVLAWSEGRALVATGSPFAPVTYDGRTHVIGQANNVFIFPGLGLGTIVSRSHEVTDRMFVAAAETLASLVSADRLASGALYPSIADLRAVSRAIAIAVAREARDSGTGRRVDDHGIERSTQPCGRRRTTRPAGRREAAHERPAEGFGHDLVE
jgi:malic enzyme